MTVNFTALAAGALSFTLALAWNDAASLTIKSLFPEPAGGKAARAAITYAIFVTLLVVAIVAIIRRTRHLVGAHGGHSAASNAVVLQERMCGPGEGAETPPDCQACARHCGVGGIVQLH
jgi:hypothetical protein